MNKQIRALLAVVTAAVLGAIMYLARSEQSTIETAQKLIANPGHQILPSGEVVFRKPRLAGLLLIMLFLWTLGLAVYSVIHNWGALHTAGPRAGIFGVLAFIPLFMGIRDLRCKIRVSNNQLVISDLKTTSALLQDVSEVKIGLARASSFSQIRLMTGEEDLRVASDLKNFPEFVSLLCEKVNESKARA